LIYLKFAVEEITKRLGPTMSSFTTFQNQGFDPSSSNRSPPNHIASDPNSNTSLASPPLPTQSFSPRNSPIRRKPLPPGASPLSPLALVSRISDQFPKPPTHKPSASAAREPFEPLVELPYGYSALDSPRLPTPEKSVTGDQNRCGMT
jgi:hypothetical protein